MLDHVGRVDPSIAALGRMNADELIAKAGSHFDPLCVRALLARKAQVEVIARQTEPENSSFETMKTLLT